MRFDVLGPIRVTDQAEATSSPGRTAPLAGKKRLGLLALLLTRANTPVSADYLLDALWGEGSDASTMQRLQTHVHRLRKALGDPDRLTFDAGNYLLRVEPGELDTDRFYDLLSRAAGSVDASSRVELLRSAVELWRGEPFQGVDLGELALFAQQLIERKHLALEELYTAELERGEHAAIVAELTELVRSQPLRERPHALLMTALYRCGRQADALAVYHDARRTFVDELGLDPGPELREVERQILAGENPPPPVSVAAPCIQPAQLPPSPRDFTGRQSEIAMLDRVSDAEDGSARVVAVTGTGGVGKTALVTHWAHTARERFPDGQLYVDLQGFSPNDPLPTGVALGGFLRALGEDTSTIPGDLAERAGWFRTLTAQKRVLVVLDNAATAEQVRPLLPGGSSCFVVVTSRDALSGLTIGQGAFRLDVERMSPQEAHDLVRAWVPHSSADQALVAQLIEHCARLPLALRVIAERLRARNSHDIPSLVADLDCERHRLDLLETGDAQTSIRAVLSWSYRQLAPETARLFRLCGFRCSHPHHYLDVHNACALLGVTDVRTSRRLLDDLVRSRLLEETPDGRYQMHELLQAFALELAEETESRLAAQERLFGYYLHGAVSAAAFTQPRELTVSAEGFPAKSTPELSDFASAAHWLDEQRSNLVCVAEMASAHGWPIYTVDLAVTLWPYLDLGDHFDQSRRVHGLAREAARKLGQQAAEGIAVRALGVLELRLERFEQAETLLEEALALHSAENDGTLRSITTMYLAAVRFATGRTEDAIRLKQRSFELCSGVNIQWMLAMPLTSFGEIARCGGWYEEAARSLEQARDIAVEHESLPIQIAALLSLTELARDTGKSVEAADYSRLASDLVQESGAHPLVRADMALFGAG